MNLPELIQADFRRLLPGVEVTVDGTYVFTKDPATGQEDVFEYKLVAAAPAEQPELFIRSSDPKMPHQRFGEFWAKRLNFPAVGERVATRLSSVLDGTHFIEPVLRIKSLSTDDSKPLECFEDAFQRSEEAKHLQLLFVSADGGRGKSTLLRKKVLDGIRYSATPMHLFIDVHGKSFASLAEHIAFALDTVAPWIAYDGFMVLLAIGAARLILDGFDELGVELGEDVVFERLRGFVDEVMDVRSEHQRHFSAQDAIRLVLSGRTQYFGSVGLRQRVQSLAHACSLIEFRPWPVDRAIDYVTTNVPSVSAEYVTSLRAGLSRIEQQHPEIYDLAVHPVALKMFAEARFNFELVEATQAAGGTTTLRGLVKLLDLGIQTLLEREEAKHISPSGTSLFPLSLQKAILEQTCAELLKSGEDPLSFDPFFVEYAAAAVAQDSALDKDASRRLAAAAPQHVLFGLGATRPVKSVGFPHQTVFDVIAGWAVSERLASGSATASTLLQAKYLDDELLASVVLRLQSSPEAMTRLADLTERNLTSKGDPTVTWNLAKLCFDRRLVGGAPAVPSRGAWEIHGGSFVQIGFDPASLDGALFTDCEFNLCELALPTNTPARFYNCLWHQCSVSAEAESKADVRRDCRVIVVSPVLFGHELPVVSDVEEVEEAFRPVGGVRFTDRPTPARTNTETQRLLLRFAKEASKRSTFRIDEIRKHVPVEEPIARRYVTRLRELGYVKERHVPFAGRDNIFSVSGDVVRAAEELFARGEFSD